jgi:hypothetical protein
MILKRILLYHNTYMIPFFIYSELLHLGNSSLFPGHIYINTR